MSALQPLLAYDLSKAYGDRVVLDGFDLVANPGQPLGLVGENGVGKSTLLRLLTGDEQCDSGAVKRPDDLGYLTQDPTFDADASVADVLAQAVAPLNDAVRRLEALAHDIGDPVAAEEYANTLEWAQHHDAWDADRRAQLAAASLGLADVASGRHVSELSGGERNRLALAALVIRRPSCLILDEPTNHLDDSAIEYLEDFLLDAPGVVVVASHDRVFLDRVCSVVVDLDDSHFGVDGVGGNRFTGGFTSYLEHKQASRQRWEQAFLDQKGELNSLRLAMKTSVRQVAHNRRPRDNDKFIYNFKGANVQATVSRRVRNAGQRIEAIERERIPKPPRPISFDAALTASACTQGLVVFVRDLEVTDRLSLPRLDVSTGEHLLVTGGNGSGKSTLLAVLAHTLEPDAGQATVRARRIGRLAQDVRFARPEQTSHQVYDAATESPTPLGDLGLLPPRELARPVGVLSVGQQRRLALAILVAGRPDLLLLDEPTNHISLALASELEDALGRSAGTVVVASHDRWLRRRWDGQTLHLQANRVGRGVQVPDLRP